MLESVIFAVLLASQQQPSATVPDIIVTPPRPDSVWCVRGRPLTGSRVRRTECRTHEEWVDRVAVHQMNADVLYKEAGAYLRDSELLEAVVEGHRLAAIRRRQQARNAAGG